MASDSGKNVIRWLESKVKPVLLVGLFLGVTMFGFCKEAKAGVTVEVGAGFLSGQYSEGQALILTEKFDKYSVDIGYITEQWVEPRVGPRTFVRENLFIGGMRHVQITEKWSTGIGMTYFLATNRALGSKVSAALLIKYQPSDRLSINIRHYSNAGAVSPNMGQDLLTVGYSF